MFTLFGPQFVRELQQRGFDIFLDLKFHDIPNTAAHAVAAAADLGVWMVNVHASGGARMMTAAREALVPFGKDAPLLIAVTVLTSMEASDLADLGVTLSPADYAERLAALTQKCGLDGVVCSAQEAVRFKQVFGQEESKPILRVFLNDVLGLDIQSSEQITLLNPIIDPKYLDDKMCILDVRVQLSDRSLIDIEIKY